MWQPLSGIRVIDLSANAPGPFTSTMLADLGAHVTRITNPGGPPSYAGGEADPLLSARSGPHNALARGKEACALDLKSEADRATLLEMVAGADVVISEMRPGKLEALGLGWEALSATNPRLVLCEITGYGREGPQAGWAGHDINYVAMAGVLSLCRDADGRPRAPQNILGDYAGGASLAANGILAALLERSTTGTGRHMTVSMTDGVKYLATDIAAATLLAGHEEESWRGTLGGEMPTYGCYETADGQWIALGALEPKFIAALAGVLGWPELGPLVASRATWPEARAGLAARFTARDRAHWEAAFEGVDACATPVRSLAEAGAEGWPSLAQVLGPRAATEA
ncbi:MAG: CoA transferase [Roseovarius sp.]